ncbi:MULTISPECIES: iron-containing alcohol dehydrogenase family protein [Mesoflavibacter]|uniref:Iron-containing alcohol dehydrogenase family protein n=1 Tax=Mesoflavibacter profundi TaxID=2708110 RepID=A0ABT4RXG6_9FLAO|nr:MULTISPECIES: iron-containing alcohol dehydrogenase family protein [Mesoflavibacter]MDA0176504.1 iron-containing alcohol dehydrogenase family protein [Mesoflavibacter profundi]QIJ90141.1 3-deoxy-manno-octulosonate cytidylyltransferase [Mesoflavibacter sp. HG96]QIJ92869.1 3-deoxy-manno-octulosonate cytidylyltransferase [Mesoflavibacter sp. HG37]
MQFKNFPMVSRIIFGRGSFNQLAEILEPKRLNTRAPFIFFVDDVFKGNAWLTSRIPLAYDDKVIYISTKEEPKTSQIDTLVEQIILNYKERPSGIIGIGGGSIMDIAKAVAIMLTNDGESKDYQGWDLVKHPAIYHVGIPTISGTGAEVSRTTILTGPERKLGINSDYTPFDQVILDPELTKEVPKDQWFYTGMDCFVHCIESLNGTYLNAFSKSYGEKAYELCKEIFLEDHLTEIEAQDKLMMASWHGGMSIAYSQVGVAHAMSYGLGYLLGIKHGIGNCIVFDHLEDYYPDGVKLFKQMKAKHNINLPKGICANLTEDQFDIMINVALSLEPLWENALGKHWKKQITPEVLKALYKKM